MTLKVTFAVWNLSISCTCGNWDELEWPSGSFSHLYCKTFQMWFFSYSCATVNKISTRIHSTEWSWRLIKFCYLLTYLFASRIPSAIANVVMCDVVVEVCTGLSFYPSSEVQAARGLDNTVLGEYCSVFDEVDELDYTSSFSFIRVSVWQRYCFRPCLFLGLFVSRITQKVTNGFFFVKFGTW